MKLRVLLPAFTFGLAVALAPPANARDCQINGILSIRGEVLPATLYISPEEKAFVEGLGLPLTPGLFQGDGLKLSDVYEWFDANGCNEDLVNLVLSKARDKAREPDDNGGPAPEPEPEPELELVLPLD